MSVESCHLEESRIQERHELLLRNILRKIPDVKLTALLRHRVLVIPSHHHREHSQSCPWPVAEPAPSGWAAGETSPSPLARRAARAAPARTATPASITGAASVTSVGWMRGEIVFYGDSSLSTIDIGVVN